MGPSTRGSKFQNAEPPCAGSNRVSSNTFLTGRLPARSVSWCDPHRDIPGNFAFFRDRRLWFSLGVGGRGRRPLESADPRGSGVRGNRRGLVQGVLEPKESYPGRCPLPPTGQTLAPWGPSSGSGTGSGGVFGPRWVQPRKS